MHIRLLDNAKDIRKAFINRFVVSWEEFQIQHKDWYEKSFMWEKLDLRFSTVSFNEAITFLKEHTGSVLFLTEKGAPVRMLLYSNRQAILLVVKRHYRHIRLVLGFFGKFNHTVDKSEQSMIFTHSNVQTRIMNCTSLAN